MAYPELLVKVGADLSKFNRGMKSLSSSLKNVGSKINGTGRAITTGLTVPLVGAGVAMVKTAGDFEQSMNQVRAVTGATGQDFIALRETAKELGATTRFSAREASEGMSFLAMAGLEANEIVEALPATLQLASAGMMDLGTASDIASNVMTAFGYEANQLNGIVDVMAKTFTSSNTSLYQLGEALSYAAPTARGFGFTLEETSAVIGMLSDAGIQASRAGTTLNNIMIRLTEAGKELGFSIYDSAGNLRPMADILDDLIQKTGSAEKAMDLFGTRGGPGLQALLSQGSDKLREFTATLSDSGGTAQEIADTQMQGFNGAMIELRSAVQGAFIALADTGVLSNLEGVVDKVTGAVRRLANAPADVQRKFLTLMGVLAGIGPALIAVGTTFIALAGAITFLTSPITLGIGAIAGLVGAFFYLRDNWQAVKERLNDTAWWRNTLITMAQLALKFHPFNLLVKAGVFAVNFLVDTFDGFVDQVATMFTRLKAEVLKILGNIATQAGGLLEKIPFTRAIGTGLKAFGELKEKASQDLHAIADEGVDFANNFEITVDSPFDGWAEGLENLKEPQGEYNEQFKTLNEYLDQAKKKFGEMTGLAFMFSGTSVPGAEGGEEGDPATPPPLVSTETTEELTALQKVMNFLGVQADQVRDSFKAVGDGIATAFSTAITFGESLSETIRGLLKQLASTALQKFLSFALTGGASGIFGTIAGGFFGKGGGLFGKIFKGVGMATGGVVPAGFPNDSYPALLTSGEMVVPKPHPLPQFGSSTVEVTGEFRVRGSDLVTAISNTNNRTLR